jgi:chromosome partitioning protein
VSKVVAFFNQSGGVGKSTLTMNLGYHLAKLNHKVLVVDMDPQSSLTHFMGLEAEELEQTIYEALLADKSLPIHKDIYGMDLVPANINLSGAELELVMADMRDVRLQEALQPVREDYDFILIDCPPSLGILSYITLVAATHVLIPIETHYKSLKGTELLLKTISRVKSRANRQLKVAGIVPTMHDSRTVQGSMSLQAIQEQLSAVGEIYPVIPRTIAFADASQEHQPLELYNSRNPAVKILNEIAKKIEAVS